MNSIAQATNVTELHACLLGVFNGLLNGSMKPKEVVEINNTAGKISSFLKVQLAYHHMRGERPEIEFLNSPPTTKMIEGEKKIEAPKK